MKGLTARRARLLLFLLGAGIATGQAMLAWGRATHVSEIIAPSLIALVFLGAAVRFVAGGVIAAGVATVGYLSALASRIDNVTPREFTGLLLTRFGTYLLLGLAAGVVARAIEQRLATLALYDELDQITGLYNAAWFAQETALEVARAERYQTLFAVAGIAIPRTAFTGKEGKRERVLRKLAGKVRASIRGSDRPAHIDDGGRDRFLVLMPQTGIEGARAFAGRLESATREFLALNGCYVDLSVVGVAYAYPADRAEIDGLRGAASAIAPSPAPSGESPVRSRTAAAS